MFDIGYLRHVKSCLLFKSLSFDFVVMLTFCNKILPPCLFALDNSNFIASPAAGDFAKLSTYVVIAMAYSEVIFPI